MNFGEVCLRTVGVLGLEAGVCFSNIKEILFIRYLQLLLVMAPCSSEQCVVKQDQFV